MLRLKFLSNMLLVIFAVTLVSSTPTPQGRADDPFKPNVVEPTVPASTDAAFLADPPAAKLAAFRKVILSEAEKSCKAGEITRMGLLRIRLVVSSPRALKNLHQACCEHVIAEGKATSATAIDWSKLLDFVKELIPLIMELIQLFTDITPPNSFDRICLRDLSPVFEPWRCEDITPTLAA